MSSHPPRALLVASICMVAAGVAATLPLKTAAAQTELVPAQNAASLLGGERAEGAVIWSHDRSYRTESSLDPTPDYIGAFRAARWDTFRLNRPHIALRGELLLGLARPTLPEALTSPGCMSYMPERNRSMA